MSQSLLPGRIMRRPGPATRVESFRGVQIDDARLADVLAPDAPLWTLYAGAVHSEGPVWHAAQDRLLWSDIPNRRVLGWYPDGRVDVVIDGTHFINGNALDAEGRLIHCEHGRRCLSRSDGNPDAMQPEPIVTHYRGRRLNSPNDVVVASDGAIWFTDPTFGILVPNQGSLMEPELDHRSVYRLDRSGELDRMADFEQPNGIGFSPDGLILYVSDTSRALDDIPGPQTGAKHEIIAFDVASTGALGNRRFFAIPTTDVRTDWRSIDAAGSGRRRPTASTSGRPTSSAWASFPHRRWPPIAHWAATTAVVFSLRPSDTYWPSI